MHGTLLARANLRNTVQDKYGLNQTNEHQKSSDQQSSKSQICLQLFNQGQPNPDMLLLANNTSRR